VPNTALLIITAGNKRYQLFLSSTEQKSAKVRFVYDKSLMTGAKPEEPKEPVKNN
jgi:type IV secretory pathway VirB9-like protein